MKKIKISIVEKKVIRTAVCFLLIQLLIVWMFVFSFNNSFPVDISETKQVDITVDDTWYVFGRRGFNRYYISSGSDIYLFYNKSIFSRPEYSNSKLDESISAGDRLSLICVESDSFSYGTVNVVLDARSDTEVYRSYENYISGKEGLPTLVIVLFLVIELVFAFVVFVDVSLNKNIYKGMWRKVKKYYRQKKAVEK